MGKRGIFIPLYDHTSDSEIEEILASLKGIGLDDSSVIKTPADYAPPVPDCELIRCEGGTTYWIGARHEADARDFASQFGKVEKSKWAGPGHYRSDVFIVVVS